MSDIIVRGLRTYLEQNLVPSDRWVMKPIQYGLLMYAGDEGIDCSELHSLESLCGILRAARFLIQNKWYGATDACVLADTGMAVGHVNKDGMFLYRQGGWNPLDTAFQVEF